MYKSLFATFNSEFWNKIRDPIFSHNRWIGYHVIAIAWFAFVTKQKKILKSKL